MTTATPQLLGPNGEPISRAVSGYVLDAARNERGSLERPAHAKIVTAQEAMAIVRDQAMNNPAALLEMVRAGNTYVQAGGGDYGAEVVNKRVRSQGVSQMTVWDRERGKPKPTPITHETLRLLSHRSEWIRAIIKTRKNQIGKVDWAIVPLDEKDSSSSTAAACRRVEKLLKRPSMYGSQPNPRSWRQFIGEWLEDLLVLDAAAIEKERTLEKDVCAMYPVDGGTIRPNINDRGGYYSDAYVQLVDGVVTARFGMEDLSYSVDNPQTDVRFTGYGMSPLENLIVSITADLYASKYNQAYFEKGSVPEGMLSLGEDAGPDDVDAFRLYWMNEIMGRPWAIPITGGKGVEWIQWRENNRDMQFMEYQGWLLKKLCAVYQLAPQEIGILEDVNRSTAQDQGEGNQEKSIEPIQMLWKDDCDLHIVGEYGLGLGDYVAFEWTAEGESAEAINAKFQPAVDGGAATRGEWREALGLDKPEEGTPGAEGLDMHLVGGALQPLPTKEDAELLSTANQQKREDDQAAQQQDGPAGPASGMPWKPGGDDDPAVRAAQRDHDAEHGIGARNAGPSPQLPGDDDDQVGKVAADGRDRDPHLTERAEDLQDVFRRHRPQLLEGLAGILSLPVGELDEDLDQAGVR